jgi:hypothetical protein
MDPPGRNEFDQSSPELLQDKQSTSVNEVSQNLSPSPEDLRNYDWQLLQEHYTDAMEIHGAAEEDLRAQISKLLEVLYLKNPIRKNTR